MKLRVEVDGENYLLDLRRNTTTSEYVIQGATAASGSASVAELMPGVFSVLLGSRSFSVQVAAAGETLEVWTGGRRHILSLADARDRSGSTKKAAAAGPIELRAQMPGKVIKLLVQVGAKVESGQGLIVIEAMKMQNEMKSPKDGIVSKIQASEGATVAAGETLIVVE